MTLALSIAWSQIVWPLVAVVGIVMILALVVVVEVRDERRDRVAPERRHLTRADDRFARSHRVDDLSRLDRLDGLPRREAES